MSWVILFEDAERRPEVFDYEAPARKRFADLQMSWNCHLFADERQIEAARREERELAAKDRKRLDWLQEVHGAEPMCVWNLDRHMWRYMGRHYDTVREALDAAIRARSTTGGKQAEPVGPTEEKR